MGTKLTRIQQKRKTADEWSQSSEILLDGEVAVVKDGNNRMIKIGNGLDPASVLPDFISGSEVIPRYPKEENNGELFLDGVLSEDGTKILNNYDRFTGTPFNGTIYQSLPSGATVDNAIWFKNKIEFGGGFSKRDYSGYIDIRIFGVKGDSATINSSLFQKAIDSFNGSSVIFYIPKGIYLINANIKLKSNVSIIGEGYDSVLKSNTPNLRIFQNLNRAETMIGQSLIDQNISIENFRIDNNRSAGTDENSHCLDLRYIKNLKVRNMWLTNAFGDGIYFRGCDGVSALDIELDNIKRQGISVTSGKNYVIRNVNGTNIDAHNLVDIEPNPGDLIDNVEVHNVKVISGDCVSPLNMYGDIRGQVKNITVDTAIGKSVNIVGVKNGSVSNMFLSSISTQAAFTVFRSEDITLQNINVDGSLVDSHKVVFSNVARVKGSGIIIKGFPSGNTNIAMDIIDTDNLVLNDVDIKDGGLFGVRTRNFKNVTINNITVDGASTYALASVPTVLSEKLRVTGLVAKNVPTGIYLLGLHTDVYVDGDLSECTTKINRHSSFSGNLSVGTVVGIKRKSYGTAAPTTGTWNVGDIYESLTTIEGGIMGWVCVASGSPGTWLPYGNIGVDLGKRTFGTTAQRPTVTTTGYRYFDTTLGRAITWTGTVWVDVNYGPATTTDFGLVRKVAVLVAPQQTAMVKTSPSAAATYTQADIQKMVDDITTLQTKLNAVITLENELINRMVNAAMIQTT
ncbi:glycosyl hydrolase family 28-related protein [Sphingobacterium mizutaii]|uniref:glycosyl hydrolase family 28-related protein n=1 Tax=Sphingobacterium mizutaii TaxID=1010 RepID=UPI0028989F3A|nr:glycosyl hydrolase family 28-related protein [Sphingobacterium mizutaii]